MRKDVWNDNKDRCFVWMMATTGLSRRGQWWPQQVSVGKDNDDDDGGADGDKDEDAETTEMYVFFCTYMSYFLQ
jgi:hypothetical protein